jgi:hypothetical protein
MSALAAHLGDVDTHIMEGETEQVASILEGDCLSVERRKVLSTDSVFHFFSGHVFPTQKT